MTSRAYDVIVIGAGVNALTAAAYLARAGRKVLVCERRDTVGGSASTVEIEPGFHVDAVQHDHGWVPNGVFRDLELDKRGLRMLARGARMVAKGEDGATLAFDTGGPDLDALRKLSPKDASRWPEFAARVEAVSGFLEHMYASAVPDTSLGEPGDMRTALRLAMRYRGLGRRDMVEVLRVLPMSIAEWLDDWFEHPLLKGALASRGITHSVYGPRAAGTAYVFLHHHVGRRAGSLGTPRATLGGTGALARALEDVAKAAGAEVRFGAGVKRIVVERGTVTGVELASGEVIGAARVVSGASPRHTFLELCDPSRLEEEFVHAVSRIRYRGAFAKVNCSLDALPALGEGVHGAIVAPTMDYLERASDDRKYGRVSERPFIHAVFASA
ncbi:MAG TPA: NAD(P)/FAD-dependent oxidoreductase, partial [Gemmatimonadaceae bacterium]|nr:NAD(P)/FAD-dependent oxidoreductase [Gemmatimonadaceae bacterium]